MVEHYGLDPNNLVINMTPNPHTNVSSGKIGMGEIDDNEYRCHTESPLYNKIELPKYVPGADDSIKVYHRIQELKEM